MTRFLIALTCSLALAAGLARACPPVGLVQASYGTQATLQAPADPACVCQPANQGAQFMLQAPAANYGYQGAVGATFNSGVGYGRVNTFGTGFGHNYGYGVNAVNTRATFGFNRFGFSHAGTVGVVRAPVVVAPASVQTVTVQRRGLFGRSVSRSVTVVGP